MIRIDEIYNNVFFPLVQDQKDKGLHWFDPFGTTDFNNICNVPPINEGQRFVFWDQEPVHLDRAAIFFNQFCPVYQDGHNITVITSEFNSEDVTHLCDTYGLQSQYYFFHGWAALDWYRGYNRTFLYKNKNIQHTFLFPNNIIGGKRKHRLAMFAELEKRDLIKDNLVSFPHTCPYENLSVSQLLDRYNIDHTIQSKLPLKIDNFYSNYANTSHQINLWEAASQSLLQLVGETVFYGNKLHLTEKTFKPIVLQQPFILASCRGSLDYLRSYGFETFSSVWDESYDLANDSERCGQIANLLEQLESADKQYLHEQCAPIVEHNYNHFYSGGFEHILWKELTDMVENW